MSMFGANAYFFVTVNGVLTIESYSWELIKKSLKRVFLQGIM
jgi:hypothetical protein